MEEQRELIPSMETLLEAEEYEETPVERNLEGENLEDAHQTSDILFSKSPMYEAVQEEDHENDDCSGDTIALGSHENEMYNNYELEGVIPPENTIPIGNIPNDDIVQPIQVEEDNTALDRGPRVENPYKARLKKVLKKYRK